MPLPRTFDPFQLLLISVAGCLGQRLCDVTDCFDEESRDWRELSRKTALNPKSCALGIGRLATDRHTGPRGSKEQGFENVVCRTYGGPDELESESWCLCSLLTGTLRSGVQIYVKLKGFGVWILEV